MPDAVRLTVEIVIDIHGRFAYPPETRAAA
jgi:hypothetical protein